MSLFNFVKLNPATLHESMEYANRSVACPKRPPEIHLSVFFLLLPSVKISPEITSADSSHAGNSIGKLLPAIS